MNIPFTSTSLFSKLVLILCTVALDFFENNLNGTIPTEIGLIEKLQHLDLGNNSLTGAIATEIGLLDLLGEFIAYGRTLPFVPTS
jgi:hypothetical protein